MRSRAFLLVLLFPLAASARPYFDLGYSAKFTSRAAIHLNGTGDLAMNRHTFEGEQTIKRDNFSLVLGGRFYAESAFATNSRYSGATVRSTESQEFVLRDFYGQYKGNGIQLRLGNQQVVWGESFGFFFADVVNPKDTREGGLGGDLAAQRVTVPMANLIWFLGDHSLQFVYIPAPFFNFTPAQGSDFAPSLTSLFPGGTVTVNDERVKALALNNGEIGIRGTTMINGWDLGLFYFNYFDRRPSYRPTFSGSDVTLRGAHDPISSVGFTGTKDLETWVARFEFLYTMNRPVDAYQYDPITPTSSFYTGFSDEFVGVLGFDYTQWRDWHLSLQISQDSYMRAIPGSLLRQHTTNLGVVLGGTLFHNHELTFISSYGPADGSSLWQLLYMVPISSRLEATLGTYLFFGGSGSQYGNFSGANRVFFQLRGFFGGT